MTQRLKVLITGSSGFIMSNFVRSSISDKKAWHIIGIDRFASTSALNSVYVHRNLDSRIADVTDEHTFSRHVESTRPDVIIHAAAHTSVDTAQDAVHEYVRNNVISTQVVASVAAKFKIRLIYISTDEVYGHLSSENDPSWKESAPLAPRNIYSASKAAGEHLVRALSNSHGLNYNVIRLANNYGPRQTSNKLIPRLIKWIIAGEKVKLYGKGQQMRDWMHVRDTYSAISAIVESGKANETYNVGAGQEFSNIEVAQIVSKALKENLNVEFVEDRPGHDFRYSLDISKIRDLGWHPEIKFKVGIEDTVSWFVNNKYYLKE